jgi:molybdopterin biosynthesis enzyme MoaB
MQPVCADGRLERAGRMSKNESRGPQLGAALSHSAALVIIGDELLAGKVKDENMQFVAARLHALGWQVTRCVVLPDDEDVIAGCAKRLLGSAACSLMRCRV